jgi:hypothetical protein
MLVVTTIAAEEGVRVDGVPMYVVFTESEHVLRRIRYICQGRGKRSIPGHVMKLPFLIAFFHVLVLGLPQHP